MGKLRAIFSVFFILGVMIFPLKSQAEAEHIYVSWIDIDHMESNPMLGWFEDMKDKIADTSPFIGQFLLPENGFSEMDEEEFSYEDDASSFPS